MTTKRQVRYSIDEIMASTIETIAKSKGITDSTVLESLVRTHLTDEFELTPIQRYHWQRSVLESRTDDILKLLGIGTMDGGLSDKIGVLIGCLSLYGGQKIIKSRYAMMELSIFEVVAQISDLDKNIYQKCATYMPKRMKQRYNTLYNNKK